MDIEFIKGQPITGIPRLCTECLNTKIGVQERAVLLLTIGIRTYGLCTQCALDLAQLMKEARKE